MKEGRHQEQRLRSPWAWLVAKVGKVGAVITVLLVLGAMTAAIAAIMAQADISGQTGTGQVALDWEADGSGDGALPGSFATSTADGSSSDAAGTALTGQAS